MDNIEYLNSHPEYRNLFPTQKMYDDFVRFMDMDEEREEDWNNVVKGTELLIEFAKVEIPKLAYEKKMIEASKKQNKVTWEDIRKKLNNIASL